MIRSAIRPLRRSTSATKTPEIFGAPRRCRFVSALPSMWCGMVSATRRSGHTSHGIALSLTQFVPLEDPIKISRLKINNTLRSNRASCRSRITWIGCSEIRITTRSVYRHRRRPPSRALLARNPWSADFKSRVAFMDMAAAQQSCTADRTEFIGRHGSLAEPAALLGAATADQSRRRRPGSLRRDADQDQP